MAIVVTGTWSSIKPKNDGKRPPMARDGIVDIQTYNEASGAITGFYTDLVDGYTRLLQGFFRSAGGFLTIHYPVAGGYLIYDGRIVTSKEDDANSTFIIAGTWRKRNTLAVDGAADAAAPDAAGQEDGIWVATKP